MDGELRDQVLLSVMGSPDARQVDGIGGANPLTSKVAIVQLSKRQGIDLDYLFTQVLVDEPRTSTLQNCGNILAGVGPYAVENRLINPSDPETTVTIYMENSDSVADVTFMTPGGAVDYDGDARIDGVPGTASPVMINFRDMEGSTSGSLLPTGKLVDIIKGIDVTCLDNGMPVVLIEAKSIERTGYESRATVLGHIQRGGSPSAFDRVLGTRFGIAAIDLVHEGNLGKMVALRGTDIVAIDLKEAVSKLRTVDMGLYDIAKVFFG